MKFFNKIVSFILRSPIHWLMSRSTLLIAFTGRKSGEQYTTPVNYIQHSRRLLTTSSRERVWWRNLREPAEIELVLRGRHRTGQGQAYEDPETIYEDLLLMMQMLRLLRNFFDVTLQDNGQPLDKDAFCKAIKGQVVVEITELQ